MNEAVTNEADNICCHATRSMIEKKRMLFRMARVLV